MIYTKTNMYWHQKILMKIRRSKKRISKTYISLILYFDFKDVQLYNEQTMCNDFERVSSALCQ